MPSFRTPFPSAFGISTFSTGFGRYSSLTNSSLIRFHSSFKYGFSCSTVIPSTPAAPLLLTTRWSAATMFSLSTTASINCSVSGPETEQLMEAVVERENMVAALQRVVSNRGAAGVDGMTVEQLKPYLKEEWKRIKEELVRDEYRPKPVLKVEIPKADGKGVRKLGIPT